MQERRRRIITTLPPTRRRGASDRRIINLLFAPARGDGRHFERPLFADQLSMQETDHFMDTESVGQDDVPPHFFDFDLERGVQNLARSSPFCSLDVKG